MYVMDVLKKDKAIPKIGQIKDINLKKLIQ